MLNKYLQIIPKSKEFYFTPVLKILYHLQKKDIKRINQIKKEFT